jgi:hypothetical protein
MIASRGRLVAGAAAIAVLAAAGGSAAQRPERSPAALADALASAPALESSGPVYAAAKARGVASARAVTVPLPAGGNVNGVRWELAGDGVEQRAIDGVLAYNAACQWLRAWRDGRDAALALRVLHTVPAWPALRGTESGAFVARAVTEAAAGGGETAKQMLTDCDASQTRETQYAAGLGLTPSR